MRRVTTLATASVVVALGFTGCGGDDVPALPAVVLPALEGVAGETTALEVGDLIGPAVINVWATWCAPCISELPDFQQASVDHPEVRFIGVDATGFGDDSESIEFLDDLGVTYEQYVDPDGKFSAGLEITELPATLVVDADGGVRLFRQGQVTYDELAEELSTG